eukprot:scaffold472_cov109-Isochrysis_galbana.AAC.3
MARRIPTPSPVIARQALAQSAGAIVPATVGKVRVGDYRRPKPPCWLRPKLALTGLGGILPPSGDIHEIASSP